MGRAQRPRRRPWFLGTVTVFVVALIAFPVPTGAIETPLDLDGDTDGNGTLEGSRAEEEVEATQAVVVACNCDRDGTDADVLCDLDDEVVNGDADRQELEPLRLRQAKLDPGVEVVLELEASADTPVPIRVFGPGPDPKPVLGPNAGRRHVLGDAERQALASGDLEFLVEGLFFGAEAVVRVRRGGEVDDEVRIRVAPFVALADGFAGRALLTKGWPAVPGDRTFEEALRDALAGTGVPLHAVETTDLWLRDAFVSGTTTAPRASRFVLLVPDRQRDGAVYPRIRQVIGDAAGIWWHPGRAGCDDRMGYGGNILVAPVRDDPHHPLGRICYGSVPSPDPTIPDLPDSETCAQGVAIEPSGLDTAWQDFFALQGVQAPIGFCTDWLYVGHLDEVLAFAPAPNEHGFVAIVASPREGLRLLEEVMGNFDEIPCCFERDFQLRYVHAIKRHRPLGLGFDAYNEEVARRILGPTSDAIEGGSPEDLGIKGILMKELGLAESEIVELPVLFTNEAGASAICRWSSRALTPNVVNMVVVGRRCLVADPVLPAFRAAIRDALGAHDLDVRFVPAWDPFHRLGGSLHCATQTLGGVAAPDIR